MSLETILSYFRDRNLIEDLVFIKENVDESLVDRIITNTSNLDRRKIHMICEALGIYHQRQVWRDESRYDLNLRHYDYECGCKNCQKELYANCTRVGILVCRNSIQEKSKKATHNDRERKIEIRKQSNKYDIFLFRHRCCD